jgi:peptide/nickel transport system permease protein
MGLDGNVRDQFSRIIHGTRVSLSVGVTTVLVAFTVGADHRRHRRLLGRMDRQRDHADHGRGARVPVIAPGHRHRLRPGPRPAQHHALAIAIVSIPQYARVMRASVLSIKEVDFVSASRALGASPKVRILWSRVSPTR